MGMPKRSKSLQWVQQQFFCTCTKATVALTCNFIIITVSLNKCIYFLVGVSMCQIIARGLTVPSKGCSF